MLTQGIGESSLAEMIEKWEDNLHKKNIKLAYLQQPGIVRLRLSTVSKDKETAVQNVEEAIKELLPIIDKFVYGFENYGEATPGLEHVVSDLLRRSGKTLALAESCTGGYISSVITKIAGASEIFKGGVVPYSNEAKNAILSVEPEVFAKYGAVSQQCVEQLAVNVKQKFKSDYGLSVSGIAGPAGGTPEKPVGLVWIAVSGPSGTESKCFQFGDDRQRNIVMTANSALDYLRKRILAE